MNLLAEIEGRWTGSLFGTAVGNLYVEFVKEAEKLSISLGAGVGGQPLNFRGAVDLMAAPPSATASEVSLAGSPQPPRRLQLTFDSLNKEQVTGKWELSDGHAGVFVMNPTFTSPREEAKTKPAVPLQMVQRARQLPKMTIYRDELQAISQALKNLLDTPYEVAVRANFLGGKEVRRLLPDFWTVPALPEKAGQLHLSLSEPGELARSINISLASGDCSFTVADERRYVPSP